MELQEYNIVDALDALIDYRGRTPKKSEKGIPTLSAKSVKMGYIDYNQCYYISKEEYDSFMVRGFPQKGDILFTTEAPLGVVAKLDRDDVAVAQRLLTLRGKKGVLDNDFLLYYLQSSEGQQRIMAKQSGSTVMGIRQEEFRKINILIPSYEEQKKIASVLSALDDKIALNKKMNQKLEAMAKRLYDYWFVQFDFPDKNGCPYKTTGGLMTYNETLKREIPEGWEVSLVSDVIKPIERGISYTSEDIKNSSGIPMINLACFDKKGNYRTGELKFYSGEYDESNKVYPLDILIACTDLTQKADIIGTPIFLSAEAPFYVFSTDLAKITPKNEFHKYFLYYYLKNPTFHRYIKPFASGTTVKHLNVKGVENYPIFIPDEKVVKQFTETVRPMVIAINERINEINRLTALRDKLLPLLMNGQVVID